MQPSETQRHEDGPRDCGTFFLDFVGQFRPADVAVRWDDQPRLTNNKVEDLIDQTWTAELAKAQACGRKLFNGRLCRLVAYQADGQRLTLTLGPVNYKEFLGTNLTHAFVRYLHGNEVLANPLGVSAAVVTADGFILMGKRSERVVYHAGRIHPVGGMVEPADADAPPDPFATILAELGEETGVAADQAGPTVLLGMVRDKHIVQPELVFEIHVTLSAAQVRQAAASAIDAEEHAELIAIRNHPSAVVSYMEQNYNALTPVGMATLLLHGQSAWGSGWFAATRGYLRSVI